MATSKAASPKPKFMMLGKSKFVHTVRTEAYDRKDSGCQTVRKYVVAGKIDYKSKGISPEAASALDPCPHCGTADVIPTLVTPEQKREEAKAKKVDLQDRIREENRPKTGKGSKPAKSKAAKVKSDKPAKEAKPKKASMTKSGPRSTASRADGDPTAIKANLLAEFGKEHGWEVKIGTDDDTGHTVVTAMRGDEVITAWFIDGKYDINRHAETRVGSWVGKLRGAHACRRQMAGEGRDRVHPEPGKGRSGPRKKDDEPEPSEDESPEDARRRVPFSVDDPDIEVIDAIKGKVIKWRNGVSGVVEEALLSGKADGKTIKGKPGRPHISVSAHPKTGRRMVTFLVVDSIGEHGEVFGPERTVYLDKIVRVVG